jgi:hypothetical protein
MAKPPAPMFPISPADVRAAVARTSAQPGDTPIRSNPDIPGSGFPTWGERSIASSAPGDAPPTGGGPDLTSRRGNKIIRRTAGRPLLSTEVARQGGARELRALQERVLAPLRRAAARSADRKAKHRGRGPTTSSGG